MKISREQLAAWLQGQNVQELHRLTNISTKTLYRIRSGGKAPNFGTLQKLIAAGALGDAKKPRKAAKPTPDAQKAAA